MKPGKLLTKVLLVFGCPVVCLAEEGGRQLCSQLLAARLAM